MPPAQDRQRGGGRAEHADPGQKRRGAGQGAGSEIGPEATVPLAEAAAAVETAARFVDAVSELLLDPSGA